MGTNPSRTIKLLSALALTPLAITACSPSQTAETAELSTASPTAASSSSLPSTTATSKSASMSQSPSSAASKPSESTNPEEKPSTEAAATPAQDGYTIDPASIATTELVTGDPASTDAYIYAEADQPALVFQTPDPQVACLMQPYGVFCMTDDSLNWVLLSVSMKPGDEAPRSIQAQGRAATHPWFKTETVLPEGQSLSWMGMTCTSTGSTSVQCHDGTRGFNLSDANGR